MATLPLTLTNGTTADANDVMAIVNEIYTDIDETNISAKTGTGNVVLQTSPTIAGPTITGTVAGGASYTAPTLTSPIVTGPLSLHSGADLNIYSDAGTTLKFDVDGATGDVSLMAGADFNVYSDAGITKQAFINGADGTGYFANGTLTIQAGSIGVNNSNPAAVNGDYNWFVVGAGNNQHLGMAIYSSNSKQGSLAFTDTGAAAQGYIIYDHSSDVLDLGAAGGTKIRIGGTNGWIPSGYVWAYDGGGDTYDVESAGNTLDRYTGGVLALRTTSTTATLYSNTTITSSLVSTTVPIQLNSGQELILDGGDASRTSIRESSAGIIAFKCNGTDSVFIEPDTIYLNSSSGNDISMTFDLGYLRIAHVGVGTTALHVDGPIATTLGGTEWELGGFTGAADAASNGYVDVTIAGVAYKLMTRA